MDAEDTWGRSLAEAKALTNDEVSQIAEAVWPGTLDGSVSDLLMRTLSVRVVLEGGRPQHLTTLECVSVLEAYAYFLLARRDARHAVEEPAA